MARTPKKNIIPQMFDVRPVDASGDLNWERIHAIGVLKDDSSKKEAPTTRSVSSVERKVFNLSEAAIRREHPFSERTAGRVAIPHETGKKSVLTDSSEERVRGEDAVPDRFILPKLPIRAFAFASAFVLFVSGGVWFFHGLLSLKGTVLGESTEGLSLATKGFDDLSAARFDHSERNFSSAYQSFSDASDSLGTIGNELAKVAQFIPGLSKISSGQGMLEGAKHLSLAGASISGMLALLPTVNGTDASRGELSLLSLLDAAGGHVDVAASEIAAAEKSLSRVNPDDIPRERRDIFLSMREKLPIAKALLSTFRENGSLIRDLLGENGPRTYLFLFQNNHELRPTGGFIGSYGLLRVSHGHVEKFFVDGIFNPDGQLKENIAPPTPIQKVSAGWSLHDSNWWPDFPTSAEKAIFFYEKTGGPTVDGVITLTPSVIEDLLRVTGPIPMPEYGVTIDAENFIPAVQEEVEVNYDKERNEPKKILADLAPVLLDTLLRSKDPGSVLFALESLSKGLSERQILLYSRNSGVQGLIDRAGWSGRLLETDRDYASVVHTNLNGYKTDGVIEEEIAHDARVQEDGSVLDTIRITRKHTGGDTPYEWWNKVNSDYLRVYVPLGSELVSARGYTYEFPEPPIDYDALGFKRDTRVMEEERTTVIHESGTRISQESGKTVFGNWVYVSPGESVTVEYTYRLPFVLSPRVADPDSYSILFQKQSGTPGSLVRHTLSFPESLFPVWDTGDAVRSGRSFSFEGKLTTDRYFGAVFMKR